MEHVAECSCEIVAQVAQNRWTTRGLANPGRGSSVVPHECFVGTALTLGGYGEWPQKFVPAVLARNEVGLLSPA